LVGFVLLPLLGSQLCFLVLVLLNLLLFVLLIGTKSDLRRDGRVWREGFWPGCVFWSAGLVLGQNYLKEALTSFEGGQVLAFHESSDATFW